jgi:EAL domain-containing protein (putative c-di-GMP-specific phosphodiesterase class I)
LLRSLKTLHRLLQLIVGGFQLRHHFVVLFGEPRVEHRHQLDSGLLELEITESMLMQDPEMTKVILLELKSLGVAIAIDDFGTGYSSLAYLKRFPVDYLKIDRSFVHDLPDNQEDVAIIKAILALAKSLKLRVIAGGVENRKQQIFLEAHGCEEGQGYLISKPLAASDMEAFLRAQLLPIHLSLGAVAA